MAIAERAIAHSPAPGEEFRPAPWHCTRDLFHQMGEEGLFKGQRVILVEGEILAMPPAGNLHRGTFTIASAMLRCVRRGLIRKRGKAF